MSSARPAVTVAAVVERDHRFLLVEEELREGLPDSGITCLQEAGS